MYVCVCVCVCDTWRETEPEKDTEGERLTVRNGAHSRRAAGLEAAGQGKRLEIPVRTMLKILIQIQSE